MAELKTSFLGVATSYGIIRRSLLLALGIGVALTLINQRDAIFGHGKVNLIQLSLSFATPFVVISLSQTLAIRKVFSELSAGGFNADGNEPFHVTAFSHGIPWRAVMIAASTGTAVAAIVIALVVSRGGGIGHVPLAPVLQVYGLSLGFSLISQTIAYRRARARVVERLRSGGGRS